MTWQNCAVCGRPSGLVSSDAPYPELCGEDAGMTEPADLSDLAIADVRRRAFGLAPVRRKSIRAKILLKARDTRGEEPSGPFIMADSRFWHMHHGLCGMPKPPCER